MENLDSSAPLELWDEITDPELKQTFQPFSTVKLMRHDHAKEIAKRLLETIDPSDNPVHAYCKLLESAIKDAAKAEEALQTMEREVTRLKQASITDDLTGILNRRGFRKELDRALERAHRKNDNGILLMIDLNDFKEINDTHGHKAGDLVLSSVATLLRRSVRRIDVAARLGGDEFAVILTSTDPVHGMEKAVGIDHELNALVVSWNGNKIYVSASIGIEHYDHNSDIETILHEADMRMYALKRGSKPAFLNQKDPAAQQPSGYPYLGKPD